MSAICFRFTWFIKSRDKHKITNDEETHIKTKYENTYLVLTFWKT